MKKNLDYFQQTSKKYKIICVKKSFVGRNKKRKKIVQSQNSRRLLFKSPSIERHKFIQVKEKEMERIYTFCHASRAKKIEKEQISTLKSN